MNELHTDKKRNMQYFSIVLVVLALFLGVQTLKSWQEYWGTSVEPKGPTISVDGKGEVFAAPDIATFSFGVESKEKTVALAQNKAKEVANAALAYLKKAGIADKDISTADYSFYPDYEYSPTIAAPCRAGEYCPPVGGKQILVGYRVSEQFTVKVRDTDKAGEIVDGLGKLAVTNVSSVTFAQDNDDTLRRQARELAIADAKVKAEALAHDLGVRLVRIINFSEGGVYPVYNKLDYRAGVSEAATAPSPTQLPQGENKITSNVTLVSEIR